MTLKKVKTKEGGFVYHTRFFYKGQRSEQRSTFTSNKREADRIDSERRKAFEMSVDYPTSGPSGKPDLTLDTLFLLYVEHGKRKGRDQDYIHGTIATYFSRWLPLYPWNLAYVTEEDKYRYIEIRRAMLTNKGQPVMYRTIIKELSALSQAMRLAKKKGYKVVFDHEEPEVPEEPLDEKQRGHYYPIPTLQKWMACIRQRQRLYALIQLLTGLRSKEFRRFELSMLRTESDEPTPGIAAYAELPGAITKNGKPRMVAITTNVYAAMRQSFPLQSTSWKDAFKGAAKRAGTPAPTERDLRHNFAEIAGLHGGEDTTIDMAMGHNSTTMRRRYQSAHDRRMANIALYVEARFNGSALDRVHPIRGQVESQWNPELLKGGAI